MTSPVTGGIGVDAGTPRVVEPPVFPARPSWWQTGSAPAALAVLLAITSLAAELGSLARPDIGFLLYAAGRVLGGATLYIDVVEINPPLIIALNMPPVLLARALGVSEILVYRLAVAAALAAALWLASRWLARLLPPADSGLRGTLIVMLAFVLFPLSAQDFGEREHLVLALALPYLLTVARRAQGQGVPTREAVLAGLLAGTAIALKPHFVLLWVVLEMYLRVRGRVAWRTVLPETVVIPLLLAVYGIAIVTFTPEYLPFVGRVAGAYGRFLHDPFAHLLVTGPGAPLVWFSLLAYAALRSRARHGELWTVSALAVVACLLAGAAQQKGLRYHFYPSFALALVLLGLIVSDTMRPVRSRVQRLYLTLGTAVVIASAVVVVVENLDQAIDLEQNTGDRDFGERVRLVRERASGGSIFVMSYHIGSSYPLINYSGVESASRFPQLWILAAEYLERLKAEPPLRYRSPPEMSASERYLNEAVLADLQTHRPELLVVLRHARDLPQNGLRRLDYLGYFGRDPRFRRVFQEYQLLTEIGDYAIYERLRPGEPRRGAAPESVPGTNDVIGAGGEVQLRLGEPAFLLRLVVFALVLAVVAVRGRARGREA